MDMDGQDWENGFGGESSWSFEEDDATFAEDQDSYLSLDGGDGGDGGDGDGDADSEEEKELDCIGKQLEEALKQIVSTLTQDEKQLITGTILNYCNGQALSTAYYKGFYFLLVTRDKTHPPGNVPLYKASANYNSAPPSQQAIIQAAIPAWDNISDSTLWTNLSEALGESAFSDSNALSADLVLSFQFARLATAAEHTANDNYLKGWGAAGLAGLATALVASFDSASDLPEMCKYMSTYSASGLGAPPFAAGAQAVLAAYSIILVTGTAEAFQKCLEGGE